MPSRAIAVETLSNAMYTETIIEEKTISYEDAAEIIAGMEDKKLITQSGKMTDTMKHKLEAGTLDLSECHCQVFTHTKVSIDVRFRDFYIYFLLS